MKAVVRRRYGGPEVLTVENVPDPEPGPRQVRVRVRASSINRADRYVLTGRPWPLRIAMGLRRPRNQGIGADFAGDIDQVGEGVQGLRVGDPVYGQHDFGQTWAERTCVPASVVSPKPPSLTYEEAAALPMAGLTALQGLMDRAAVRAGERVVVHGATGGVGSLAVAVAVAAGAEVTAVCSPRAAAAVRDGGAAHVLSYAELRDTSACWDVFFDVAGTIGLDACLARVAPGGRYVAAGAPDGGPLGPLRHLLGLALRAPFARRRVLLYAQTVDAQRLAQLTTWVEARGLRPVVSRIFPLDAVREALRCATEERPAGKVVLRIASGC